MECNLIDERAQDEEGAVAVIGEKYAEAAGSLARAVIDCREQLTLGLYPLMLKKYLSEPLSWLAYACEHPGRGKRKVQVDVDKMVEVWVPLLVTLATAHDIDEKDQASSAMDEYLKPIIAAPVEQIREFYRKLVKTLKKDSRVPWAVWRLFEFWGENVLDKIEKEEVEGIQKEMALRIVQNSFEQIPKQDWINSMVGALQWRSPERLKEIESSLTSGTKPRVRGKESCLFLQVGEHEVML